MLGLATESYSDAVGELDNGHTSVSGTCHGTTDRGDVEEKAVWTNKAADLTNDDEEHHWTFCLSADHYIHHSLCR